MLTKRELFIVFEVAAKIQSVIDGFEAKLTQESFRTLVVQGVSESLSQTLGKILKSHYQRSNPFAVTRRAPAREYDQCVLVVVGKGNREPGNNIHNGWSPGSTNLLLRLRNNSTPPKESEEEVVS